MPAVVIQRQSIPRAPLTRAEVETIASRLLRREQLPETIEISVVFTDNEGIRQLNRDYRAIDAPTDVLSFPQMEREEIPRVAVVGEVLLGDVVVSVDAARQQAREMGHTIKQEVALLLVHGMLHLVGYDHESPAEAEQMSQAERDVLAGAAYLDRAS